MSSLFLDYLDNWRKVQPFYSQPYSLEAIANFSRTRPRPSAEHLARLCAALSEQQRRFGSGQRGVEKLAKGAVAVVTGQQPGLFTGPFLSILKAISAVKLASKLEESGISAVPVFWVASEDHDYEEIQSTWVQNRDSGLCKVTVDLSNPQPTPAGWAEYRDDIRVAVRDSLACSPQTDFVQEVRDLLEAAYRPGVSPVDAFGIMMGRLFSSTDLILVDPMHPELKELARPVVERAVAKNDALRAALLARSADVSRAGYHEQVKVDENFTGLFAFRGRSRQVLRPAELAPNLALSPNVLLRPVVQDTLFPTATYIAGPAEIAYFAQASAAYETLECPMPPIFPRISATLVEPRIARALEKYKIGFMEVLQDRDALRRKAVDAVQGGESFNQLRSRLEDELKSLRSLLSSVDPTLAGALDTSQRKMIHQVESLRNKYARAVARRDETLERHLDAITHSLFPDKKLQERVLNTISFLVRYGTGITGRLRDDLSLDTTKHQLIDI